jgi:choline dehydrogenase
MILGKFLALLAASASVAVAVELEDYEYVIVGSGAGGGPLAARLALAGHKTLLIEAGDDHGTKLNYSIPAYNAKVSEDEELAWNFFVRHYADDARQARDFKTSYQTPDGGEYTGLNPPEGSTMKGTLYPRTGSLGGCTSHNALIAVYPHQSDFNEIASLTGDESWSAANMRKYFAKMEQNHFLPTGVPGHGYDGWLATEQAPLSIVLGDVSLLSMLTGAAFALGNLTGSIIDLGSLIAGDTNADSIERDTNEAYYQIPLSMNDGSRNGAREFVLAVRDAVNEDGTKKYPLHVRLNCHATKVTFDNTVSPPRAAGVEFLDGKYLYRASPLSGSASSGIPGSVNATREVILAGGVYNSPQLLKLSGVGPAEELAKFNIPLVANLPGVGTNLQDHYEISVQAKVPANWTAFEGCKWEFESGPDACLEKWQNPVQGDHGTYSSAGLAAAMFFKSTTAPTADWDTFVFGGPVNFRGYFPNYSYNATSEHDWFTWAILKSHPRNTAGHVTLRSADPLDVPDILFNYFDTGVGDGNADVQAMVEAVGLARDAFARQLVPTTEILPGAAITSQEDMASYVKDTAWGHHASCTCPIGVDSDPMAVLDSKFRVRGVSGLRVVDASVYPRIPGTFTAVSTYMVGEKAADVILSEL